jgi:hypothetical protein
MCTSPGRSAPISTPELLQADDLALDGHTFGDLAPLQVERLDHGQVDALLLGIDALDPHIHRLPHLHHVFDAVGVRFLQLRDGSRPALRADIDQERLPALCNDCSCILVLALDLRKERLTVALRLVAASFSMALFSCWHPAGLV